MTDGRLSDEQVRETIATLLREKGHQAEWGEPSRYSILLQVDGHHAASFRTTPAGRIQISAGGWPETSRQFYSRKAGWDFPVIAEEIHGVAERLKARKGQTTLANALTKEYGMDFLTVQGKREGVTITLRDLDEATARRVLAAYRESPS